MPAGATPAKRQVNGRKLLLWLGGAAVVAAAAFAVIRFVDFGGGEPQASPPPATLPPDPEPPPTTTTTMVPTTTTAPPIVEIVDPDPSAADEGDEDSQSSQAAEQAAGVDADAEQSGNAMPPAAVAVLTIRDAGDFTGQVTLQCVEHAVRLAWHVHPPYEPAPEAELQRDRERTPAPIGSQGFVRVVIDTFVPADIELDAAAESTSGGTVEDAGDEPSADGESAGADPDEVPSDETVEDAAAEEDAVPAAEAVLVLEARDISGRGTDREGVGEATGLMHHGCPAPGLDEFAEWTVTVEGHAEVAWELAFEIMLDEANVLEGDAAGADETGDGAESVGDLVGQIVDGAVQDGGEQ